MKLEIPLNQYSLKKSTNVLFVTKSGIKIEYSFRHTHSASRKTSMVLLSTSKISEEMYHIELNDNSYTRKGNRGL